MTRIFPRTHHNFPNTKSAIRKARLPLARALAIMNLPPDGENIQFNGGLIAQLTWADNRDDASFARHRNALNKFSYSNGIGERPTNLDYSGDVVLGKYKGKEPCRWPPSTWVALVDVSLQTRCIQIQRMVARHQIEARKVGRTFVYLYSTQLDDVIYVELTRLHSHECNFSDVDWANNSKHHDSTECTKVFTKKYIAITARPIFSKPTKIIALLLAAASFAIWALFTQKQVPEVEEESLPRSSVALNSSTPPLYNGDSF